VGKFSGGKDDKDFGLNFEETADYAPTADNFT